MHTLEDLIRATRSLGADMNDHVQQESERIWAGAVRVKPADLRMDADLRYGTDARHRLDVYSRPGQDPRPVFVYVHGGGFTGGDKRKPDSYLFENVGAWAVHAGMVGVNLTYRLAPQHRWPAVVQDIAAALQWVRDHIHEYGGDPRTIVLAGHSAGAAHVANYVARTASPEVPYPAVQGAVLCSGMYDIVAAGNRPSVQTYYGADPAEHEKQSSIAGLCAGHTPLLIAVAENEPYVFHRQALALVDALATQHGKMPLFTVVQGHNHFSETYHFGSEDTQLTGMIARFAHSSTAAGMAGR